MAYFGLLWKARAIENQRLKYEDAKLYSIMMSEASMPKKTFAQKIKFCRYDVQKKATSVFKKWCPEGSRTSNFVLYLQRNRVFPNILARTLIGFASGILLTYLCFMFFVFQLAISLIHATIMSSIIGVLLTLGLAFSNRIRCLVFLLIPQLFSRVGRYTLTCYALVLILTGPATNTLKNSEVLSESMACTQEHLKINAKQLNDSMKKPFNLIKDDLKVMLEQVKVIAVKMKTIMTKVYRLTLSVSRSIHFSALLLDSAKKKCNKRFGTPYQRCLNAVQEGTEDCRNKFGPGIEHSSLCDPAEAIKQICDPLKTAKGFCSSVGYRGVNLVASVKRKLNQFSEHMKTMIRVQVHIQHSYSFSSNGSRSVSQVAAGIVTEIRNRADPLLTWLSWSSCVTSLFFFLIIFRAKNYQYMFETRSRFDNRYITQELRQLDLKRQRQGRETILPLNRRERAKYITTTSFRLVASEKVYLNRSAVFMAITTFKLLIHMVADYSLYWVLMTIRYHGRRQTPIPAGPPEAGVIISGSGPIAGMFSALVRAMSQPLLSPGAAPFACLPRPSKPCLKRYMQIGVLIFLLWFFAMFEPYGLRLRHIIMGHYKPERAKARAVWLYSHILRTRASFMKFARKKLHRRYKYSTEESFTYRHWIQSHVPFVWLQSLLGAGPKVMSCLLCGTTEVLNDPDTQLTRCESLDCPGVYCTPCFSDIGQLCTICMPPADYGDTSDISLELGSSDESDEDDDSLNSPDDKSLRKRLLNSSRLYYDEESNNDSSEKYQLYQNKRNIENIFRRSQNLKTNYDNCCNDNFENVIKESEVKILKRALLIKHKKYSAMTSKHKIEEFHGNISMNFCPFSNLCASKERKSLTTNFKKINHVGDRNTIHKLKRVSYRKIHSKFIVKRVRSKSRLKRRKNKIQSQSVCFKSRYKISNIQRKSTADGHQIQQITTIVQGVFLPVYLSMKLIKRLIHCSSYHISRNGSNVQIQKYIKEIEIRLAHKNATCFTGSNRLKKRQSKISKYQITSCPLFTQNSKNELKNSSKTKKSNITTSTPIASCSLADINKTNINDAMEEKSSIGVLKEQNNKETSMGSERNSKNVITLDSTYESIKTGNMCLRWSKYLLLGSLCSPSILKRLFKRKEPKNAAKIKNHKRRKKKEKYSNKHMNKKQTELIDQLQKERVDMGYDKLDFQKSKVNHENAQKYRIATFIAEQGWIKKYYKSKANLNKCGSRLIATGSSEMLEAVTELDKEHHLPDDEICREAINNGKLDVHIHQIEDLKTAIMEEPINENDKNIVEMYNNDATHDKKISNVKDSLEVSSNLHGVSKVINQRAIVDKRNDDFDEYIDKMCDLDSSRNYTVDDLEIVDIDKFIKNSSRNHTSRPLSMLKRLFRIKDSPSQKLQENIVMPLTVDKEVLVEPFAQSRSIQCFLEVAKDDRVTQVKTKTRHVHAAMRKTNKPCTCVGFSTTHTKETCNCATQYDCCTKDVFTMCEMMKDTLTADAYNLTEEPCKDTDNKISDTASNLIMNIIKPQMNEDEGAFGTHVEAPKSLYETYTEESSANKEETADTPTTETDNTVGDIAHRLFTIYRDSNVRNHSLNIETTITSTVSTESVTISYDKIEVTDDSSKTTATVCSQLTPKYIKRLPLKNIITKVITKANQSTATERIRRCDVSTLTSDWWSPLIEKKNFKDYTVQRKQAGNTSKNQALKISRHVEVNGRIVSFRSEAQIIPQRYEDLMSPSRFLEESQKYYNELYASKRTKKSVATSTPIRERKQKNKSDVPLVIENYRQATKNKKDSHKGRRLESISPRKLISPRRLIKYKWIAEDKDAERKKKRDQKSQMHPKHKSNHRSTKIKKITRQIIKDCGLLKSSKIHDKEECFLSSGIYLHNAPQQ